MGFDFKTVLTGEKMIALLFFVVMIGIFLLNRKLFGGFCISDLFTLMWFTCAGLASTGMFGLYTPGWIVYAMALFCGVFFNVVYITFRKLSGIRYIPPKGSDFGDSISYGVVLALNAVAWIVCLLYLPHTIRILLTDGFSALRQTAYVASDWASTYELMMFQWIIQPIFAATCVITSVSLVLHLRRARMLLCVSVVGIVLYILLFGGRGLIVKCVIFMALAMLFRESGNILQIIKKYRKIVFFALAAVLILFWLTTLRSFAGYNVLGNIYMYFVAPFVYLRQLLDVHPVGEMILWGSATLNFVVCFFWMVARIFFGIDYNAPDYIITSNDAVYYQIGEHASMNAMPTMMYPFLLDFGYPGLIFGVLVFALLACAVERHFYRARTIRSFAFLVFFGHMVLFSVQNYGLFRPENSMILIFIFLFTTRIRYRDGVLRLR